MSVLSDTYLARATQCAREAREATLENVRERSLRAEAAWRAMADRAISTDQARLRHQVEKARALASANE
ncbi:MAG: hypothetical protein QM690_10715 [Sphingobium sp.]